MACLATTESATAKELPEIRPGFLVGSLWLLLRVFFPGVCLS